MLVSTIMIAALVKNSWSKLFTSAVTEGTSRKMRTDANLQACGRM